MNIIDKNYLSKQFENFANKISSVFSKEGHTHKTSEIDNLDEIVNNKVDKEEGKGLSTNDLTDTLKSEYDEAYNHSISAHAPIEAEKNIIVGIQQNEVDLEVGEDRKVNIKIPTNVSEFQNDANYLTEESDPTVPQHVKDITKNDINNWNSVKISEGNTVFWNEDNKLYVPIKNEIIIYTDYYVDENRLIPNIKIGDGQVPVIDLPFLHQNLSEEIITHIQDSTIHVTANDKLKWDNKVSCDINESEENIIFYI